MGSFPASLMRVHACNRNSVGVAFFDGLPIVEALGEPRRALR